MAGLPSALATAALFCLPAAACLAYAGRRYEADARLASGTVFPMAPKDTMQAA